MAISNMNAHAYRKHISESAKPVPVEFSAPWCGYCRHLEPALAKEEQIELVPILFLYQNGQLLGSIVAPESGAQLEKFIEESLGQRNGEQTEEKHSYDMLVFGGD